MRNHGKVVGNHHHTSVLGLYKLEVRVSLENNCFHVLVPTGPEARVNVRDPRTFEVVSGATLVEVKREVAAFIDGRDQTEYDDVIEYHCGDRAFSRGEPGVEFDFRVARVSRVLDHNGDPRLEKQVEVSDEGVIADYLWQGEGTKPVRWRGEFSSSMPFTVVRWRKCRAIQEGVRKLQAALRDLFGKEEEAGARLDALSMTGRLLGGLSGEESGR
jgi:hypothetical protein